MRTPAAALLLTLLTSPLMAQTPRRALDSARTRVWFEAGATLGAFQGTAQRVSGWVEAPDTAGWTGATGHVEVEVASFGTGIALRNRHLRDYMEAARYPRVTFELDRVEPGNGREVMLHGRLTLKAVTREVRIPATIVSTDPLVVDGRLATRFTEWGMQPATRMGGLTRVRDPIVLRFHAVFPLEHGSIR
jgi:polyisoprenoid-binding protein YceI